MIVHFIIPIEILSGKIDNDGYYFRLYRGRQIAQRCPTRWHDTPARQAARQRFIEQYAKKKSLSRGLQ